MRTHLLLSSAAWVATVAAALVGCGSLDSQTGTPTQLTAVTGQLLNREGVSIGDDIRVAVVWLGAVDGYNVAEDLPLKAVFPSRFVLPIDQPPPAEAMQRSPDSESQAAAGFVVAYEDVNGNGKLDLVENDAGAFVDKIVATNETLALIFLQGVIPAGGPDSGTVPSLGYNLFEFRHCPAAAPEAGASGAPAVDGGACIPQQWFGMDTPYDLAFSSDPEVNQLMCRTHAQGGGSTATGSNWDVGRQGVPPGGYPPAGAAGLTCLTPSSYSYAQCETIHNGLCAEVSQSCTQTEVDLGDAGEPASWPCP